MLQFMTTFMAASRQTVNLDKERIKLDLENLVEESKANIVEKDTRLNHLQK